MKQISLETKEAIVKQVLGRNGESIKAIAKKNNISYSTLKRWVNAKKQGRALGKTLLSSTECSSADKLNHLLLTTDLNETELGSYCRSQGIYSHQLLTWKEEFMKENSDQKIRKDLKELRAENKRLKKELGRKDKALAETSALLILKKKAHLIWGESEDV